ncbi:hypothetical protein [Bradyrhizobium sp. CCBAU 11386]|uniref:hypothetical protein n=1 Tax=Bradyrhizobium sp. CCBAU 11386 TaxID=1630837 RepID=UPI00230382B9|nr:hypothetical protein [Bradyrhizobium sp. CCBAU 11386]
MRTLLRTAAFFLMSSPAATIAGGTCLLHPEPFKLQSDTVHWSMKIASGGECIQGLRWSTIMIDNITITEQPKAGRLMIQGPSFRYFSNPGGTAAIRSSCPSQEFRCMSRGVRRSRSR